MGDFSWGAVELLHHLCPERKHGTPRVRRSALALIVQTVTGQTGWSGYSRGLRKNSASCVDESQYAVIVRLTMSNSGKKNDQ